MFMDFLTSLSIFGAKAPQERMQELVEIIEGQADLDAQFDVSLLLFFLCKFAVLYRTNLFKLIMLHHPENEVKFLDFINMIVLVMLYY